MGIDPVTIAIIGQVVSGVGAVVSTVSGMKADAYTAAIAERNSALAEENAQKALEKSQIDQMEQDEVARAQIGNLIAGLGASGVDSGTGSSAITQKGTRALARRDAERIRQEGVNTAEGFRTQGADFTAEAEHARRRKKFTLMQGVITGTSGYLDGANAINKAKALVA